MRKLAGLACAVLTAAVLVGATQQDKPETKPPASRNLKVKLNYTGSGTVDEKHKIILFLFDSPDFVQGGVMPIAGKPATAKDETVAFTDLSTTTVYIAAAYDPKGEYDGESGPPPSGASMGMYSKTPGKAEPVTLESGKAAQVELAFDDSVKMP